MKISKYISWFIVIFVIAPVLVFLINFLFFPKNGDAEKYVTDYIENSTEIKLYVPSRKEADKYFKTDRVYTGLGTAFSRGKLSGKRVEKMVFFNNEYQKYFSLSIIAEKEIQFDAYYRIASGRDVIAEVNKYELESPDYGTRENPVPIFMLNIPNVTHPDFIKVLITEEQYVRTVSFYLTYIMPKKEFKERFEKGKEYDFEYENSETKANAKTQD
jgi:hypothetical protein